MISAVLYREGNRFRGCRITGHSGYAPAGRDIVCAAVSVLSCTCVNALESVCGVVPRVTGNENGLLTFELPETGGTQDRDAQVLMGALRQGLADVAEAYPQNVKLTISERRE